MRFDSSLKKLLILFEFIRFSKHKIFNFKYLFFFRNFVTELLMQQANGKKQCMERTKDMFLFLTQYLTNTVS